jgi:hypothetical protein
VSFGVFDVSDKPATVNFIGFESEGEWCIPTRYAVAHAGGLRGSSSIDVFNPTASNPKFSVRNSSKGMTWFRAVAPSYVWQNHIMTRQNDGTFVDEDNPCPDIVTLEFVRFQSEARPGTPSWCTPTAYRAVYGSRSSIVEVAASATHINPMIMLTPDIPVEWFKQGDEGEWVAHSMERVVGTQAVYVDLVNGCEVPILEFRGVNMPSPHNMPWLVPTRYCAAFMLGGTVGPTCTPSEIAFSTTHRQPGFRVANNRLGQVIWFRAMAPDFEWQEHDMHDNTEGNYTDLQTVPIPTPPAPTGNGLYDNKWNQVATVGEVPWLLPSRYRVRYVFEEYASDWSEYTEDYVSDQYTTPSLKAEPPPADVFRVHWEACGSYISLPVFDNYYQTFKMTFDGDLFWGISAPVRRLWPHDFMMPLASFVNAWNSLDVGPYPWPMNLLPDGRLQLTVMKGGGVPGTGFWLFDSSSDEWWSLMGFDTAGVWPLGEPITSAESVAVLGCVSKVGLEFVDGV